MVDDTDSSPYEYSRDHTLEFAGKQIVASYDLRFTIHHFIVLLGVLRIRPCPCGVSSIAHEVYLGLAIHVRQQSQGSAGHNSSANR